MDVVVGDHTLFCDVFDMRFEAETTFQFVSQIECGINIVFETEVVGHVGDVIAL